MGYGTVLDHYPVAVVQAPAFSLNFVHMHFIIVYIYLSLFVIVFKW